MNALKTLAMAHETEFALDEKNEFIAHARRNMRLGHWAGELLGKPDVDAYADELVTSGLARRHGEFSRLRKDFDAAGVVVSDDEIQTRMSHLLRDVLADMRRA